MCTVYAHTLNTLSIAHAPTLVQFVSEFTSIAETTGRAPPARGSYLLLVNPQVLAKAGMNPEDVVTAMCLSCGIPTILSGLFGNLPFVMAPGVNPLCNGGTLDPKP